MLQQGAGDVDTAALAARELADGAAQQLAQGGAVVRLHVIDHQVIDRPVFQDRADIVDELFAERYFDRVDQSDFFVDDQV